MTTLTTLTLTTEKNERKKWQEKVHFSKNPLRTI